MWLRWRCRRWWPPLQGGQEIVHSIFSWRVTSILEKSCSSIIQRVVSHEKWALSSLFLSVCAHDLKYCLEKVQPYFWLRRKTFKKWRDFPLHNFRFALGPNHETKQRAKKKSWTTLMTITILLFDHGFCSSVIFNTKKFWFFMIYALQFILSITLEVCCRSFFWGPLSVTIVRRQ